MQRRKVKQERQSPSQNCLSIAAGERRADGSFSVLPKRGEAFS